MKKEYGFSKGERGKFYHAEAQLEFPVYLEPDVAAFLRKVAAQKGMEVEALVNDWSSERYRTDRDGHAIETKPGDV